MSAWDDRFMNLARHISAWSKDSGRKVGAVVVGPDNKIRSTGFNGIARSVDDDVPGRHRRDGGEKYAWTCCAEHNAIYNAARVGIPLLGCRIYSTLYSCAACAIALIQTGLIELVTFVPDFDDPQWGKDYKRSETMLREAGLRVRFFDH